MIIAILKMKGFRWEYSLSSGPLCNPPPYSGGTYKDNGSKTVYRKLHNEQKKPFSSIKASSIFV